MSEWVIGLGYLTFCAVILFLVRRDEARENRAIELKIRREQRAHAKKNTPRTSDAAWSAAYAASKSVQTEVAWRAWMEERGYGPESILERAELRGKVTKRKR